MELTLYRELRPRDPELPEAKALLRKLLSNPDLALVVCECDDTLAATCMLAIVPNLASGGRPFGVLEHVVTLNDFAAAVSVERSCSSPWKSRGLETATRSFCCRARSAARHMRCTKLWASVVTWSAGLLRSA